MSTDLGPAGADARIDRLVAGMDVGELLGQLLCVYLHEKDADGLIDRLESGGVRPGGFLLTSRSSAQAAADVARVQDWSRVPMLVAANLESGTSQFLTDGRTYARPLQIAATRDPIHARRLGESCALRGREVGVNWAFAPVADVLLDSRNPIVGTRAFGAQAELVAELAAANVEALQAHGVAACPKHWPGDGVDARDQHLLTSVNDLPLEQWQEVFGTIYRRLVAADSWSIMVGHIALPAIGPDPRRSMPASLRAELVDGLLRDDLGFDGLVVSDNTLMAGFLRAMARAEAIPTALNAGVDMLLGSQFAAEDLQSLRAALEDGRISEERVVTAATRVLRLKARLGLLDEQPSLGREILASEETDFDEWAGRLARASVTLVRGTQAELPVRAHDGPSVLMYVLGDQPTFYEPTGGLAVQLADAFRQRGFDVTVRHVPGEGRTVLTEIELQSAADLVVYFANHTFESDSNTARIRWSYPQAPEVPRTADTRVVLVSVSDPYDLQDIPSADIAVNGYTPNPQTVDALVAVLLDGAPAPGISPVDPYAGTVPEQIRPRPRVDAR